MKKYGNIGHLLTNWQKDPVEYRGVRILKFVPDLWNYQEIILEYKITNVIEFGSKFGGSAIYFADILKLFGTGGKVLCVDIKDNFASETDRPDIQKLVASSTSDICRETVRIFREKNPGNVYDVRTLPPSCSRAKF